MLPPCRLAVLPPCRRLSFFAPFLRISC